MKSIIFHIPFETNPAHPSGTNLRPIKMIHAFENIGFQIDIISGNGKTRKKSIDQIKQHIDQGKKYQFMYSESSTLPTLLTEKHHLPTYPFLDFGFFRYCHDNNIPIGLFYRDIFWNFDEYRLKGVKAFYTKFMYHYDLKKYNKFVDILYLPCAKMLEYIPLKLTNQIEELPPGFTIQPTEKKEVHEAKISLLYVGGLSSHYQMEKLLEAVSTLNFVELTICTRENEWKAAKKLSYAKFSSMKNLNIVHKQNHELAKLYLQADITLLFVKPFEYWKFAVPIKLFEYIGNKKPIIASKGTEVGDFVEKNNVGWTIPYQTNALINLLKFLRENPNEIRKKREQVTLVYPNHSWEARAKKVAKQLNPHPL